MSLEKGYVKTQEHRDTRRTPYEKGGKNCSDTAASQGTPRIANNHQEKLEVSHGTNSPFETPEGTKLADSLITDF